VKTKGRVFLLDDDELITSMLARALTRVGYRVQAETDPHGALDKIRSFAPEVVLLDIKLPGASGLDLLQEIVSQSIARQVVMLTSDDSAETAVTAMKLGAADYLTKPFDLEEVKIVVENVIEKGALRREVDYLRRVSSELIDRPFVGDSTGIEELKQQAVKLARAGVAVILIAGESGTGKEVLARYIHRARHGDDSISTPFIGINCAALPETLIESELFGHEKGAFTDAKTDKKGVFEMAYGGSILLDEIGEMKPSLQSKLLRVLEERVIRRVGGRREIAVDATVFATTNRNLEEAVGKGEFRQDLYYRLNAFSMQIPPLRERPDDIPVLARYFLGQFSSTLDGFAPEAMSLLRSHAWPGNVRELRNVIERITVLESGETVLPEHLPRAILKQDEAPATTGAAGFTLPATGISLDELERNLIAQALELSGGNKTEAAKLLDLTYDSLRYQIKKFGLG
jgi:DNA-binding NtrC family response regulator